MTGEFLRPVCSNRLGSIAIVYLRWGRFLGSFEDKAGKKATLYTKSTSGDQQTPSWRKPSEELLVTGSKSADGASKAFSRLNVAAGGLGPGRGQNAGMYIHTQPRVIRRGRKHLDDTSQM